MAGKKKKTLANRLAKMSDEERAKYLQHKADIEEEAKRRKEQLISTFMKKKIKKEDGFSRLNLAKINQQWHQMLRKIKCQEMKDDVLHMKKWIERVLDYKNRTIDKLLEELEESEEQYLHNFQSHSIHITQTIESQNQYLEKAQLDFNEELEELMALSQNETKIIRKKHEEDREYLEMLLYGEQTITDGKLKQWHDYYSLRSYECVVLNQSTLRRLKKSCETISGTIWRQVAEVVKLYIYQTDKRRLHLAELTRLDKEAAVVTSRNDLQIQQEQELIRNLTRDLQEITLEKQEEIRGLEGELQDLSRGFLQIKQQLQKDLQCDEKQLRVLTDLAYNCVNHLKEVWGKGEQILLMREICRKFETKREEVKRFLPKLLDEFYEDPTETATKPTRAKTAAPASRKFKKQPAVETLDYSPESSPIATITEVELSQKSSEKSLEDDDLEPEENEFVKKSIEGLKDLENFWLDYSKVEVDIMEIKEEKNMLMKENKELRGMIRAVLEAAVLAKSIPDSKVATRVPSKRRSACSAPLRRLVFS